jgi:hypothetical protein
LILLLNRPTICIKRRSGLAAVLNALLVYVVTVRAKAIERPMPEQMLIASVWRGMVADRGLGAHTTLCT